MSLPTGTELAGGIFFGSIRLIGKIFMGQNKILVKNFGQKIVGRKNFGWKEIC